MHASQDDTYLITRVLKGDQAAFGVLVNRYKDMVFSIVLKVVGQREQAEDIAQEVFVKVYKSLPKFRQDSKLSTWLYRVAYNEAISHTRRNKNVYFTSIDIEDNPLQLKDDMPDNECMSFEEKQDIAEQLLAMLPEKDKIIIQLFYIESQRIEQISQIMGISVSNVKVKLHRIRKLLQEEAGKVVKRHEVG